VIDAMDECTEDKDGRPGGELLPLLLRGLLRLSGRIKLLLMSRVEPEIMRMFELASLGSQQRVMQLHNLDAAVVRSDIRTYLIRSFADIATSRHNLDLLNWPSQEDINALVDLAEVLFVFAATVVRFVGTPRHNPRARLDILLARRESNAAMPYHLLDQLYVCVLETSVRSEQQGDKEVLCERLRNVVGSIVSVQQPLSVQMHAILLDMKLAEVQLTVESLSALLLSRHDAPVRIFHPSFPNFIVDHRRCEDPRFHVQIHEYHLRRARRCLELLNRHLRYNMIDLDNPDVANSDVEDLDVRLLSLPQGLFYAACHWTTHVVSSSAMSSELLDALGCFCNNHLFHWLELLSLIQSLTFDTQTRLLEVVRWSKVRSSFLKLSPTNRFTSPSWMMSRCLGSIISLKIRYICYKFTPSLYGHTHCMLSTARM
jgi:hypothetical protein